jgi:hypothetical protein
MLFISHRTRLVTVIARTASGWRESEFREGERAVVADPSLELDVAELYAGIRLESADR